MPTLKDQVFMELALREGLCPPEKLDQITTTQSELEKFGISKFVGALVVEKGAAPKEDVAALIELLDGHLVLCGSCGKGCAVSSCDRQGNLRCTHCSKPIELPEGRLSQEQLWEGSAGAEGGRRQSSTGQRASGRRQGRRSHRDPLAAKSFAHHPRSSPVGSPEVTRFHVQDLVGVSASGSLYRIVDNSNFGALKVIDSALYADRGIFKVWVEVMQKVQDLPRSATLKPTQLVRDGSLHYVVRPYVEPPGCSLKAWLARKADSSAEPAGLSMKQAVGISVAVLNSLAAFHSARVVHGNLRPENVLLDRDAVLLTDPGILLLFGGLDPEDRLLRLWDFRRYLAPEVLQGGEPTFASDVFSAGRLLEDLLERCASESGPSSGGAKESELRRRIQDLAAGMVAFDPAERPPTAKDVLRDIQTPSGSNAGKAPGGRRSSVVRRHGAGRLIPRKISVPQAVGPAVLLLALGWVAVQAWTWNTDRAVLRSGAYAEELMANLLRQETDALVQATARNRTSLRVAEERWDKILELYRGTSLEATARDASKRALDLLKGAHEEAARSAVQKAESEARKGQWAQALVTLLRCEDSLGDTSLWARQLEEVTRGLRDATGLIYVPGGTVTLPVQGRTQPFEVAPFLIEAAPVPQGVGERALRANGRDGEIDPEGSGDPWVNIGLRQARKAAASLNRRIPTLAEWTRFAQETGRDTIGLEPSRGSDSSSAPALFEWVEEMQADALSRADYGVCVGGARHGVSPTHPVRRKVTYGYPDVGVRFVQDLDLGGDRP